jgi:Tfp pilus assembly protein PilF
LGTALLQAGRCDEALEALQRSRELDPTNPNTHINIATCYKKLGRNEEARTAYLAAGSLDSTVLYRGNINMEFAGALVETGRLADAESTLTRMARQPGMLDQALGFRGLGYLSLWRGQVAMAQDRFRRAAALSRQQRAPNSLFRNLLLLAAAQRAAGDQAEMRRTLRQVDSVNALLQLVPGFLTLAVEGHAEALDTRRVRSLLGLMRSRADPRSREDSAHVAYVTGTLGLMEASPREGLAALEKAKALAFPGMLALRRALAHEQLDQLDSARAVLRTLAAAPSFGSEDQIAWTRALLVVGAVEERLGRFDDAVASYRRFLEQWKDADPGLPDVVRIRARLNALLSRADRP